MRMIIVYDENKKDFVLTPVNIQEQNIISKLLKPQRVWIRPIKIRDDTSNVGSEADTKKAWKFRIELD